jgi:hypothetical protein
MSETVENLTDKNKKHITIKKINIIVETNIEGEKPFSITYDKIYNPVKNKIISSQKKLDYPFITFDIKYDENVLYELNKKDYSELLRAFFDMTYFTSMVKKMREKKGNVADNPDEKTKNQIINHNIFMMLYFLFPIKYPIPNNITSSYNSKICNSPGEFSVTLNRANVQTSFFSTFFNRFKNIEQERIREYSYVNTSKGESTITQIIWLNDFLNEPRYRELVDTLIQYEEWLSNRKITIDEDIQNAQKDLFENAANDEKDSDDDYFKKNELEMIRKEIKFEYSFEKFKEDVINELKKTFVINKDFDIGDDFVTFVTLVQDKVIERIYGKDGKEGINDKQLSGTVLQFEDFRKLVDKFEIKYKIEPRSDSKNTKFITFTDTVDDIKRKINKVTLKENLIKMVESILDELYETIKDIRLEDISYALTPDKTTPQMSASSSPSPLGDYGEVYEISSSIFLEKINTHYCYKLIAASCGNEKYTPPKIINLKGLDCLKYKKKKKYKRILEYSILFIFIETI